MRLRSVSWFGLQLWRQPCLMPALSRSCWRLVRVLRSWRAVEMEGLA